MVIETANPINMGGIILDQALPIGLSQNVGPFLLLHHWKSTIEKGSKPQDLGVGPHPHRGFSPVTFIYKGAIQHRDSRGNDSVVHAGGVQWMNAGRGIVHSERPPREIAEMGGEFELIQIWINNPKAYKMIQPKYVAKQKAEIPVWQEGGIDIQIVAGSYSGISGAVQPLIDLNVYNLSSVEDGNIGLVLRQNWSSLIYLIEGDAVINDSQMKSKQVALIAKNSKDHSLDIKLAAGTKCLVLSGADIEEPVAQYGPFVMNTQTEVLEALRDAQMGKMGILIEAF